MTRFESELDRIADEFEAAWRNGLSPKIDSFIGRVERRQTSELLKLLIPLDIEYRITAGESVVAQDYQPFGEVGESIALRELEEYQFQLDNLFATRDSGPNGKRPHAKESEELPTTQGLSSMWKKSQQLGPYKLLQKLGEGGMGTVWMAEQEKPVRRKVALKLIKADKSDQQYIARFEAERQALAMMDHQNIAKVLDAGTTPQGEPYLVMELVQGVPFNLYCDKNKLSINERLELFIPVCKAVQHAHQKGIIHRDLKPSNVLVCLYDGKPVPKVIDFGLAKAMQHTQKLTDKTVFTEFGQVMGSLQYMSPEQAELNQLDIDTRSDIYSLGVMLYELLTGSTPIDLDTMRQQAFHKVLESIREQEPPRPSARLSSATLEAASGISNQRRIEVSKLKNILVGELDWIVMRALEKDRTRRYETANGFAADIENYLAGDVVTARPPSTAYRIRKYIRRHKGIVASFTATTSLLVAGLIVSSWFWYSAENARKDADDARKVAINKTVEVESEKKKVEAQSKLAIKNLRLATAEAKRAKAAIASQSFELANVRWNQNRTKDAVEFLEKVPSDERNFEWSLCNRLFEGSEITLPGRQNSNINDLAFSPDGTRLAVSHSDGSIILWDLKNGTERIHAASSSSAGGLAFSNDSRLLSIGIEDAIAIMDVESGDIIRQLDGVSGITTALAFSPDGGELVTCSRPSWKRSDKEKPRTAIWDAKNWKQQVELPEISGNSISFAPDGTQFAIGDYKHTIETATGRNLLEIPDHNDAYFSPDGKFLYTSSGDKISQLNAKDGKLIKKYESKSGPIIDFCLSPDGMRMATVHLNKTIQITCLVTGDVEHKLKGHLSDITNICFSPDCTRLATSGNDKNVKIWNVTTNSLMSRTFLTESENTHFLGKAYKLLPKSSLVLGAFGNIPDYLGHYEWIVLFDYTTGKEIRRWQPHSERFESFECSPDGKLVATVSEDKKSVKVWDLNSGTEVAFWDIADFAAERFRVCFSPDNATLAGASYRAVSTNPQKDEYESVIAKFELSTKRRIELFHEKSPGDDALLNLCYCSSGSKIAACGPGSVFVLDASSGEVIGNFPRSRNSYSSGESTELCFSEATQQLAAIKPAEYLSDEGLVQIINLDSGESFRLPDDINPFVYSCFSPDGTRIVTADKSGKLKLWDPKDGRELLEWQGHEADVSDLAWPAADRIVSVDNQGTVIHWEGRKEPPYEKLHSPQYRFPLFAGSRNKLVFHDLDGTIHIADPETGKTERKLIGHTGEVKSICLSNYGDFVISTGSDGTVRLWDIDSGKQLRQFSNQSDTVYAKVLVTPNDDNAIGLSENGTVCMWRIATGEQLAQLDASNSTMPRFEFNRNGSLIAIIGENIPITIWNGSSGKTVATLGDGLEINRVEFSPMTNYVVGQAKGVSYLLDIVTGRELMSQKDENAEGYHQVWFSPDERRLAIHSRTQGLKIWDVHTGKLVSEYECPNEWISNAGFSPDGNKFFARFDNAKATLVWDVERNKKILDEKHYGNICFSLDNQVFAWTSNDSSLRLMNASTGDLLLETYAKGASNICFSPDGKTLAYSCDSEIRILDVAKGKEVRSWESGHLNKVNHLCISSDGTLLVTTGDDNTIRFWHYQSGEGTGYFVANTRTLGGLKFRKDGKELSVEDLYGSTPVGLDISRRKQGQFVIPNWYQDGSILGSGWVVFHPVEGAILIHPNGLSDDRRWDLKRDYSGFEMRHGDLIALESEFLLLDRTSAIRTLKDVSGRHSVRNRQWHLSQSEMASKDDDSYARLFHRAMILAASPDDVEAWDNVYTAYRKWQRASEMVDSKFLPPIVQEMVAVPRSIPLSNTEIEERERSQGFSDKMELQRRIWPNVKSPILPSLVDIEPIERLRSLLKTEPNTFYSDFNKTLSVAEYRLENFEAAINVYGRWLSHENLLNGDYFYDSLAGAFHPIDFAVIAMSHFKLGDMEQAKAYRQHFNKAMKLRRFQQDDDCLSFASEVDLLFDGRVKAETRVGERKLTEEQQQAIELLNNQIRTRVSSNEPAEPLDPNKVTEFRKLVELSPIGIYLNTLGTAEFRLGNWQAAIEACSQSAVLSPEEEGYPCPHPIDLAVIAMSHFKLGNVDEANKFLGQFAQAMKTQKFNDDNESLSFAREVLPVFEQTLQQLKTSLGGDHPDTLSSMNSLATVYHAVGQLDISLPLFEQSLELMRTADHPDTLNSINNLATVYRKAGQLVKALQLDEQALEQMKIQLGPEHDDTLTRMATLAVENWKEKQLDRSVPLFEQLLVLHEKKFGRENVDTQRTVANLGVNYKDAGRIEEAIPLLQESYESSREKPELVWVRSQLVDAYLKANRRNECLPLLQEIVKNARGEHPAESLGLAGELVNAADDYLQLSHFTEAVELLREAVEIRNTYAPDAWNTYNARSLLGDGLLGLANGTGVAEEKIRLLTEAEPLLVEGYEGMKARENSIPLDAGTRIPESLDRLIDLYTSLEKSEEAEKYRKLRAAYPSSKADGDSVEKPKAEVGK